ncbi:MAG: right-handed parallel beta-helix repeat-containing protein [Nannocystales bacterium]
MKRVGVVGIGIGVWLAVPSLSQAETYEIAAGDDIEAAIATLQPGDELVLGGGMYVVEQHFGVDLVGTEAQPITIRARDGEVPHVHRPNANQNIVDINAQWVTFEGIEWSGGSAGLRISSADHLTISQCDIHSTNDVAVRANDSGVTYQALHIVDNEIHDTDHTGEGMYLGCNNDACRVTNSVIERNWVHHTNGPTITQGDGIELKEGSHGNIIRDNVIHDTNYPCILTYSAVGNGEANIIEGNAMWNCGDHAIQSAADSVIRNNIILSANASGISLQPHQSGAPDNILIAHNTIVVPGSRAINVSGAVGPVTIANNAVYSEAGPAIRVAGEVGQIVIVGNIGLGGLEGANAGYADGDLVADFVDAGFHGGVPNDVFPSAGALQGTGTADYAAEFDFNGLPVNDPPDVGAYAFDADGNPGWILQAGFKQFPDIDEGETDGGTDGSTGGGNDTGGGGDDGSSGGNDSNAEGGGSSDSSTSDSGGTNASGDASSSGPGADDDAGGEDGCGCRSSGGSTPLGLLALAMFGALTRRRRS